MCMRAGNHACVRGREAHLDLHQQGVLAGEQLGEGERAEALGVGPARVACMVRPAGQEHSRRAAAGLARHLAQLQQRELRRSLLVHQYPAQHSACVQNRMHILLC